MANETTLSKLKLQFESDITQSKIDNVTAMAAAMEKLNGVKISKSLANNASGLFTGFNAISNADKNVNGLNELTTALQRLNGVKISKNIGDGLLNLTQGLNSIGTVSSVPTQLLSNLTQIGVSMQSFSGITTNMTGVAKLIEVMGGLGKIQPIPNTIISNARTLATAINELGKNVNLSTSQLNALTRASNLVAPSLKTTGAAAQASSGGFANMYLKLKSVGFAAQSVVNGFMSLVRSSSQYIEDVNLFSVSMGEFGKQAYDYAQQVQSIAGIDAGKWMRNQGLFMSMASAMGIANEKAYIMSDGMAKLTYDIASFYNISDELAATKLRSALAGEIEPMRALGVSLTQATLQEYALTQGIQKKVNAMTDAEKSMLRYNYMMKTTSLAQGDMARTLSSPMNQLRIARAQFDLLARTLGNIFLPILQAILPWIIAFAQALRQLIVWIGAFFGVKVTDFSEAFASMGASSGAVADNVGDTASGLGKANKAAKELKKTISGFDEAYTINDKMDDTAGGGGGAGGVGGGGLDIPIETYDFLKGMTEQYSGLVNKIKDILGVVLEVGAGLALWALAKNLIKNMETFKKLVESVDGAFNFGVGLVGFALIFDGINKIISGVKDIISNGVNFDNVTLILQGFSEAIGGVFMALGRIDLAAPMIVVSGVIGIIKDIKSIATEGINFNNLTSLVENFGLVLLGIGAWKKNATLAGVGAIVKGVIDIIQAIKKIQAEGFTASNIWDLVKGAMFTIGGILLVMKGFPVIKGATDITKTIFPTLQQAGNIASGGTVGGGSGVMPLKLPSVGTVTKFVAELGIVIGGVIAIVGIIGLLMKIPGVKRNIETGIDTIVALSKAFAVMAIEFVALGAAMYLMGKLNINAKDIAMGTASLGIIVGGVTAIVAVIGLLSAIPSFDWVVTAGVKTINAVGHTFDDCYAQFLILGGVMLLLGALSALTGLSVAAFALGASNIGIIVGGIVLVVTAIGALSLIPGFDWVVDSGVATISKVGHAFDDCYVQFLILGGIMLSLGAMPFSSVALLAGATAIGAFVIGITAVVAAVGAISKIPGLEWLVGEGIAFLQKVAKGIGEVAGSFQSGYYEAFATGLSNATHSFDQVDNTSIQRMSEAIEVAGKIKEIPKTSIWGATLGSNYALTAYDLASFGANMRIALESFRGIDANSVSNMRLVIEAAGLVKEIPRTSIWGMAFGSSYSITAVDIGNFGVVMQTTVQSFDNINQASVQKMEIVLEAVGKIKEIPKTSIWAYAFGSTYSQTAKDLSAFGLAMQSTANNFLLINQAGAERIAVIVSAISTIDQIPESSIWAGIFGTDKATTARDLGVFAYEMIGTANNFLAIPMEGITKIAPVVDGINVVQNLNIGNADLNKIGKNLEEFGKHINKFNEYILPFDVNKVQEIPKSIQNMINSFNSFTFDGLKQNIQNSIYTYIQQVNYTTIADKLNEMLKNAINNTKSYDFSNLKNIIYNALQTYIKSINYTEVANSEKTYLQNAINLTNYDFGRLGSTIQNEIKNKLNFMNYGELSKVVRDKLNTSLNNETYDLGGVSNKIYNAIRNSVNNTNFYGIGTNIAAGVVNGINNYATSINVLKFTNALKQKMQVSFTIKSPSRWARDIIGENISAGVEVGINDYAFDLQALQNNVEKATSSISPEMQMKADNLFGDITKTTMPTFANDNSQNYNIDSSNTEKAINEQTERTEYLLTQLIEAVRDGKQIIIDGDVLAETVNTSNRNRAVMANQPW